jgi:predicted phage terminase large subunit-like protein
MDELPASTWKPKMRDDGTPAPQALFLSCGALEASMGGVVGGGKTSALLAAPLRNVHRRGFGGVIFRRSYPELTKPDGLIERAAALFRGVGAEGKDSGKTWVWPSGARIDLAAMDHPDDRFRYEGSAFQYVAFDELQTFELRQYLYLFTRLRQNALTFEDPIPLRMRSSCTPGGPHHDEVVEHFAPWIRGAVDSDGAPLDPSWTGYRAYDGERLYYRFDELKDELVLCRQGEPGARSRCFFSTEMLDEVGQEYRDNLDLLDPLTRQQRKYGNWLIKPGAGLFFTSASFVYVDRGPTIVRARCRGWDLAATPKKPGEAEGKTAATAGVLISIDQLGDVFVEDVKRDWIGPGEAENLVKDTAGADDDVYGGHVLVSAPQDPGQAGKHQKVSYAGTLAGRYFVMTPEVGDKIDRIKPLSAHARRRPIRIVRGPWNQAYVKELIAFPFGLKDQGDASSRAYAECLRMPALVPSRDERQGQVGQQRRAQRETARGFGGY